MAQMFKLNECKSWLEDWETYAANRPSTSAFVARRIIRAATEQRANLENVKLYGHSGWCDPVEYEKGVELLEAAAEKWKKWQECREESAKQDTTAPMKQTFEQWAAAKGFLTDGAGRIPRASQQDANEIAEMARGAGFSVNVIEGAEIATGPRAGQISEWLVALTRPQPFGGIEVQEQ